MAPHRPPAQCLGACSSKAGSKGRLQKCLLLAPRAVHLPIGSLACMQGTTIASVLDNAHASCTVRALAHALQSDPQVRFPHHTVLYVPYVHPRALFVRPRPFVSCVCVCVSAVAIVQHPSTVHDLKVVYCCNHRCAATIMATRTRGQLHGFARDTNENGNLLTRAGRSPHGRAALQQVPPVPYHTARRRLGAEAPGQPSHRARHGPARLGHLSRQHMHTCTHDAVCRHQRA